MKTRFLAFITLIIFIFMITGMFFIFIFYKKHPVSATVLVEKGETIGQISEVLYENQLIRSKYFFKVGTRIFHVEKRIKAGFYRFQGEMTLYQIIMELTTGKDRLVHVTFPEGLTCREMFRILVLKGLGKEKQYLQLFNNPKQFLPAEFKEAETLEGFLFPDTYFFPQQANEPEILREMIRQFMEHFHKASANSIALQPLSSFERLILASLIEKETSREGERPLVASVFLNRLKIHMKLDCDPTIIYSMMREGKWDGNIRKSDISMENPYNTYVHRGLPPGPISNPGEASLYAAFHPARSDYLYFVSKNDGTHVFASHYSEHLKNVRRYQIRYWRRKKQKK